MALSSGDTLGPYEILAPIGAGGMGEVWKARDTRLDRIVAIKTSRVEFSERFAREARAVAALNHPNICQLYDVGTLPQGGGYLVMEFVDGAPIASVDSPRKVLDLAAQFADGMAAAHAAGFTHRDLKPDNVLVTGPQTAHPGRVKILDFGIAKFAESIAAAESSQTVAPSTNPGTVLGTVSYMSPEQARGQEVDARSDQFSFGLMLYELAAGKRAFAGASAAETMSAIIRDEAEPLPSSVPTALRWVVERCLAKDPAERYDSTRDLYRELKLARERLSEASASGPQAVVPPPARRRPRWQVWAAATMAGLAIAAVSFGAARSLWRTPEPPVWTGTMLGGSEMALNPRISPDGHLLAFEAMVDGQSQIAVMKPESGNWSILTRDRNRGPVGTHSWSADGTLIYYDRFTDALQGIFSVPVLGGDERLVLESALSPEPLPDGSLLIVKLNAEGRFQLHRFWPETGRVQALPIRVSQDYFLSVPIRADADGRTAVAWGEPVGQVTSAPGFYAIDLSSASIRRLDSPGLNRVDSLAFALARNGQTFFGSVHAGALIRILGISMSGADAEKPLFTTTSLVWQIDAGPDESLYANMVDRPVDVVRFAVDGTGVERLASFPQVPDPITMTVLPDGRAVLPVRAASQVRLMVVQKGKEPAPLINTADETDAPVTTCGPREIAFMIGNEPHETIGIAEPESGRIVRTIAPGKGPVESVACSPDGLTLFFVARGVVWSIPTSAPAAAEARKIRSGDGVVADPSGRRLIVKVQEISRQRRFIVPLDGGPEHEIPPDASISSGAMALSPNALNADGRLLTPLLLRDSWFNPPGVTDTVTGRTTRIPSDNLSDYHSIGWTPDGHVMALKIGLRSTLWKFQPVAR